MISQMNAISITPVANGFLVYLPTSNPVPDEPNYMGPIISMVNKIKSGKDDLLSQIEDDVKKEEQVNNERNIDTFRNPSIHCFHTLREVLFFLAERFDVSLYK